MPAPDPWGRLLAILATMDVPALRRQPDDANARWLSRNIAVRNAGHPDIQEAAALIRTILSSP